MKKFFLRSAVATASLVAGSLILHAQGAGGGGAAAGAGSAGAAASGAVSSGTAAGASGAAGAVGAARGTTVSGPASGVTTAPRTGTVVPQRVRGQAPAAGNQTLGGSSVLETTPNVAGGTVAGNGIVAPDPAAGARSIISADGLQSGVAGQNQAVAPANLPVSVQSALQGYAASGALGTVTQVQGRNGNIYQASVVQNGVPMQLQIGANGQILSSTPIAQSQGLGVGGAGTAGAVGTAGGAAGANNAIGGALAGLPVSSLPQAVQNSLRTQIGQAGQVQTISQDQLANGTVFRVTALQNGVPTELTYSGNGTLLSSAPVAGAGTSFVVPGTVALTDLPENVRDVVQREAGENINRLTRQRTADGLAYVVSYDQDGRPMTLVVGPDGRVRSNGPAATGAGASGASGAGASTNSPAGQSQSSISVQDLPGDVKSVLEREAEGSEVRYVNKEERVGQDAYAIGIRGEDIVGELTIAADGKILEDTRMNIGELAVPKQPDPEPLGIPYNDVPVAIQNAIKAYATAGDIRSITLGLDKDAQTVYDVIFYRDGRRDRLVVDKQGNLKRTERNVAPALDLNRNTRIAVGDLPTKVQDTIRRQTDTVLIRQIEPKQVENQTVYSVQYETNGAPRELLVGVDGSVVYVEGGEEAESESAPLPASLPANEESPVRVIQASTADALVPANAASVGTAAPGEQGVRAEPGISTASVPRAEVKLSDLPPAVQQKATDLAGTGNIQSISPTLKDSGVSYEVIIEENGVRRTITLDKDGALIPAQE